MDRWKYRSDTGEWFGHSSRIDELSEEALKDLLKQYRKKMGLLPKGK